MKRESGVLMHITALPGQYGIGTLGQEAYHFIDVLSNIGFRVWQMLPICPIREEDGNSPYTSISSLAINPYLIDLENLEGMGLLTKLELNSNIHGDPYNAAFGELEEKRIPLFRKAFSRLDQQQALQLDRFQTEEGSWLEEYSLFMVLLEMHHGAPWWQWEQPYRTYDPANLPALDREFATQMRFYAFLQWIAAAQWQQLYEYATAKGISLIGDVPIYPSRNSVDCWSNRRQFAISEDLSFDKVAGVPPDYFSADGQLWGNPLYDWKQMALDGYRWWKRRMALTLGRFHGVRIDHFRGIYAYWAVPAGSTSARQGSWEQGPGLPFLRAVLAGWGDKLIIAEDLGLIDDDVRRFVEQSGLPGMRVIQFGFEGGAAHLPHNYTRDMVAYTGTHDNNTLLGWLYEASPEQRKFALDYVGFDGDWGKGGASAPAVQAIIRAALASVAPLVMIPIQDLFGYGADARMNRPGIAQGNWSFRIVRRELDQLDRNYYKRLMKLYDR